jgi:hypothetical protein
MTAVADLLTRADRRRLLERLAEADELNRLMREPGGLPSVPKPVPLHRRHQDNTLSTENTPTLSTPERTTTS